MGEQLTISQPNGRKAPSIELPVTLLVRQPSSPYARAEAMVEHCIIWGGVADLWFSMVPATYGHDHRLDATMFAIEAVCHYRQAFPGSTLAKCHATMAVALQALREAMLDEKERWSDFTLAAVAGLSPMEAVRTERAMLVTAHAKGLGTLLYERVGKVPLSRLSAGVFVYHISDDLLLNCLAGTASRLEQVQDSYLTHDSLSWYGEPALILRHAGTRISLGLPRLLEYTRAARVRRDDPKSTALALELAEVICGLRDTKVMGAGEQFIEGLVNVPTTVPDDRSVTPTSLDFHNAEDFHAALLYWHTRMALLRICGRLHALDASAYDAYELPSPVEISIELQLLGKAIVRSSQYSRQRMGQIRRRLYAQSLLMCWGVLHDKSSAGEQSVCEQQVRVWLLSRIDDLLGSSVALAPQDLDTAADLFVGGPLVGTFRAFFMTETKV
nr:hypothetical protein B0A51_11272 [Rachicladosporium sp. CCFEE 5018]